MIPSQQNHYNIFQSNFDSRYDCCPLLVPKLFDKAESMCFGSKSCASQNLNLCPKSPPLASIRHATHKSFIYNSRWPIKKRCNNHCKMIAMLFPLLLLSPSANCSGTSDLTSTTSNQSNVSLSLAPTTTKLPTYSLTHHHHHSHIHLSKLLFPLASSSFASKSFKATTFKPKLNVNNANNESNISFIDPPASTNDPNQISRKRKRELFALTIAETEPVKTLRPATFWSNTPAVGRRRRVSGHPGSNAITAHSKSKSSFLAFSGLSPSSSNIASGINGANAAAGNMRMKIMLNPSGFGTGLVPDQKCNFEIYPSGCFDENGSICDNSGSGLCVCRPGYSIRIGAVYCLRPAAIGEACYTTEQCERKVANSGCFNYREEYREENPSAFFGPSQSSWPMGECRCRIGHRYDELTKSCVRSLIGSWCSNVWDCEMVEDDDRSADTESLPRRDHANHTRHSMLPLLPWHSSSNHVHGIRAKMANIVCENNTCACSQFFHYNTTAEECKFVETFGQACRPGAETHSPKRNIRSHASIGSSNLGIFGSSFSRHHLSPYHSRQLRSLPEPESLVVCNLPSICSSNGTCVCADGFEHHATSTPKCLPINGGHLTHFYKSGSSGRSGVKNEHGGTTYDREGHSNIANFLEYVLYILVPALVVIFMFKPCFRRIGKKFFIYKITIQFIASLSEHFS